MNLIKNIFLYFSAFIPMYFLILMKYVVEFINNNISFNVLNITNLVLQIILIIFGVIGLIWNIKWNKDTSEKVMITSVNNITERHFLGYFSIFILFALSFDLTKICMFCQFVFIIIFVGIVYVNNHLFFINPFLNLIGFNFYDITYKKENDNNEYSAKLFYRGRLESGKEYYNIKLKNNHFSFIDKK